MVAQSDFNLAIWYNIDVPQHVTMVSIRGEVMQVVRDEVNCLPKNHRSTPFYLTISSGTGYNRSENARRTNRTLVSFGPRTR